MKTIYKRIRVLLRLNLRGPDQFKIISGPEGEPVGTMLEVYHPGGTPDIIKTACFYRMTEEVMMKGVPANAIRVLQTEERGRKTVTKFQPIRI